MEVQLTAGSAEVEAPESDAPYLTLTPPTQGVTLRLSAQPLTQANLTAGAARNEGAGLLAVSNTFGWCVAATNQGFSLFALPSLLSTFSSTPAHTTPTVPPTLEVSTTAPLDHVKFAMSEKVVVAAMRDGTVGVWRLKSLVEGNPTPSHLFPAASSPLTHFLPCPAPSSPLLFALSAAHILHVYNLQSLTCSAPFPALPSPPTALAWSVKGKQVTLGTQTGGISQWTPEGQQKSAEIPIPSSLVEMGGQWEVRALEWLENTVWLVFYGRPTAPGAEPNHEEEVFILNKAAGGEVEYTRFMDPTPAFGMMSRAPRRWIGRFRNWNPYSHLLFLASSPSTDVGVLSQSNSPLSQVSSAEAHGWSSLSLPDTSRPSLPLTEEGGDVCPLSLELVLSGEDGAKPEVWVYTSEGVLVSWRVANEMPSGGNGEEKYDGMRKGGWLDVRTQEDLADAAQPSAAAPAPPAGDAMAITPAPTPAPSQPNPFATTSSPFGAPSSSPFAVPSSSSTTSTGAGAFGAPAFGAKPAFGASPFGASPFGSSATPSATPAFGASPFGGAVTSTAGSPFGALASPSSSTTGAAGGGFAGFGAASASPFGAAAAPKPAAEGGSIFGSGAKFGAAPAFGSATSSPAPAAASAFGGGGSAFGGATKTTSAFGGASKTTSAFGGSAFGSTSTPAFGQSAFGSAAPSTTSTASTPAPAPAPAFGSTSAPAFGASPFASKPAPTSPATSAATTPTSAPAFGSSPFATTTPSTSKPASSTPAFGQSPFGAPSTPAFGASPFGTPSSTPAAGGGFAGFGSAAVAAATSSSPAAGGFGAFSKPTAFSAAPAGASPFASSAGGASPFASAAGESSPFASAGAGKSVFGASTATPKTTAPSAFGTGGSAFGSGGSAFGAGGVASSPSSTPSKPSAFTSRPSADSDDEEEEEEEDDGKKVRADEPPDLEPTKEGLDLMQSMREAKGSLEKREEKSETNKDAPSTATSASAFGFSGLGFGASPSAAAPPATSQPLGTSIFGSATPTTVRTPPAGGFGAFGSALKPSAGFSFGSAPAVKEESEVEKQEKVTKEQETKEQETKEQETKGEQREAVEEKKEEKQPEVEQEKDVEEEKKSSTPPPSSPTSINKPTTPATASAPTTPSSSTKTLFGFASSPTQTPSAAHGSLLGRLEQAEAEEEEEGRDEEEGQYEEEDGEEYDEEYDEGDGEGEGEGDYDDEEHEEEVHYEGESEEEQGDEQDDQEDDKDDRESTPTPAAAPSLLSRLSPAPPSPSPSPSPSPAPAATSAPSFSFATSVPPPAQSPFSLAPASSPSTSPAPTTDKPATSPFDGFSGFASSSSATSPALQAPAFSFASSSSAPAASAPKPAFSGFGAPPPVAPKSDDEKKQDEVPKSLFGGFGPPAMTKEKDEVKEDKAAEVKTEEPPTKPSASFGFGGFATSTPAAPPAASAPAPASFFNLKSNAPKSSSPLSAAPTSSFLAPSATTAPLIKSPLSFGSSAPQPKTSPSPFALAPPVAAATATPLPPSAPQSPAPSSMSSMFGGFQGVSKPAAPSPAPAATFHTPSTSPFAAAPAPASSPFAPTPTSTVAAKLAPAPAPSTPQRSGPSLSSASTPKLGSALVKAEKPQVQETGMAGEFLKAYLRVEKDFEILRENSTIIKSFVKDIGQAYQPRDTDQPINYDDKYWSLGDLGQLREATKKVEPSVRELVEMAQQQKRQAAELQSLMLKAETKREEAARFMRARSDPAFAKMVRIRQLGPEQVENQKKIRLAMEAVRTRVEQVEDHVVALKDKMMEERLGRSSFKAPSLDTINRSIRNVTAAAHEKALELDALAGRLDLLRLQPSSQALSTRHRSPSIPTAEDSLSSSVFRASPSVKSRSVVVKPDAVDTAKRALEAERRLAGLKSSLLSVRKTPLFNQAAEESTSNARTTNDIVDLNLAFARGAITAGRLPRPRRPPPPPAPAPTSIKPATALSSKPTPLSFTPSPAFTLTTTPQASPTPSWTLPSAPPPPAEGTPPPLTFKAPISFSFAPSATASSPPAAAGASTSRARGGSSRAHSSAVQLRSGGSPSAPTIDPASFWSMSSAASAPPKQDFQSFSFGAPSLPSPSSTSTSFSGFGTKHEEESDGEDFEEENAGEEEYEEWEGEDEEDDGDELGLDTVDEEEEE